MTGTGMNKRKVSDETIYYVSKLQLLLKCDAIVHILLKVWRARSANEIVELALQVNYPNFTTKQ